MSVSRKELRDLALKAGFWPEDIDFINDTDWKARALAAESKLARLEEWAQAFLKATPRELMDAAAIKGMKARVKQLVRP